MRHNLGQQRAEVANDYFLLPFWIAFGFSTHFVNESFIFECVSFNNGVVLALVFSQPALVASLACSQPFLDASLMFFHPSTVALLASSQLFFDDATAYSHASRCKAPFSSATSTSWLQQPGVLGMSQLPLRSLRKITLFPVPSCFTGSRPPGARTPGTAPALSTPNEAMPATRRESRSRPWLSSLKLGPSSYPTSVTIRSMEPTTTSSERGIFFLLVSKGMTTVAGVLRQNLLPGLTG
mmetsp:Transcript_37178/g.90668  ORF Transcript_37178/g.90668 Transcript_37178/m.90668 type:complete len:238 (+) Transcript_37178:279-992(+)